MSHLEQWLIKNGRRVYQRLYPHIPVQDKDYDKPIASPQNGNDFIASKIEAGKPFLAARLGSTELSVLANFIQIQNAKNDKRLSHYINQIKGYNAKWNPIIRNNISFYSGLFPTTDEMLERFSTLYLNDLRQVDVFGVWYNAFEDYICKHYCNQANFVNLTSIEPYYHKKPWSKNLKDRVVLVIHPFAKSIEKQLINRRKLFNDPDTLPDFECIAIPAIQTIANNETSFKNWFEALDHMCEQIQRYNFDVAIIGAGAYGLPLGAFVKRLGKQAIHMGGATQILFGIKGKRWDNHSVVSTLYNDFWTRPTEEEKPKRADNVEGGCYW